MERTELEKLIEVNDEQLLSGYGAQLRDRNAAHAHNLAQRISRSALAEMRGAPAPRSPVSIVDVLMRGRRGLAFSAAMLVLSVFAAGYIVFGGRPANPEVTAVASSEGVSISARHSGPLGIEWWLPLATANNVASLTSGDEIQTNAATSVTLSFANGTTAVIAPNSLARIESIAPLSLRVINGSVDNHVVAATTPGRPAFEVYTERGTYTVRGTIYSVQVARAGDQIRTREGSVAVRTVKEEKIVERGEQADVSDSGLITRQLSAPDVVLTLAGGQTAGPGDRITTNARGATITILTAAHAQITATLTSKGKVVPFVSGISANERGEGEIQVPLPLDEGTSAIVVMATDTSSETIGTASAQPINLLVDRTTPSRFVLTAPPNNAAASSPAMLAGITEPGTHMTVNGSLTTVQSDGRFIANVPLKVGPNAVEFTITDDAGNTLRVEETIYLLQ